MTYPDLTSSPKPRQAYHLPVQVRSSPYPSFCGVILVACTGGFRRERRADSAETGQAWPSPARGMPLREKCQVLGPVSRGNLDSERRTVIMRLNSNGVQANHCIRILAQFTEAKACQVIPDQLSHWEGLLLSVLRTNRWVPGRFPYRVIMAYGL